MKKIIVLLIAILAPAAMLPAADLPLSIGGGGLLGYTFTRYTLKGGNIESKQSMDRFNYGGGIFFDAKFWELSLMFQGGTSSYTEDMSAGSNPLSKGKGKGYESSFGFSMMGKYPFKVGNKFTLFPLVGIEYQMAVIQRRQPEGTDVVYNRTKGDLQADKNKDDEPYPLSAWNSFWIDVGGGVDYDIAKKLFLRGELIFGFRLKTGYENGALEVVKEKFDISDPKLAGLTGGPNLRLSLGYRIR